MVKKSMGTITKVFKFLEHNHQWNEAFQAAEYKKCLTHCVDGRISWASY
ncbi:hypothetical protein CFter6_1295 [Collimonas fungivorans]|uniref:Uncharacterized protein n=1 Tax=Collimonas fungivorans TaxID=158899 RepID=A0A127P8B9_9BURK|nr:hypothetical protein CFter6_1295 [Collimonas fungivorans]